MATIALTPGRVPPHDLDAEVSVLGSILLDPLSIAKVLQFLHPEDFYRENNGQVYRAALDLFAAGEPIDNVTLAAQLQTLGMLDRVGGRAALASMQEVLPTVLALAAASLLYVAVADLIPSLHRHPSPGDTARQLALIGVGIAIIAIAHVALEH